jgi:hypothetical protein
LYDLRPQYIDAIRYYPDMYDWSHTLSWDDTQGANDQFFEVVKLYVQICIPIKVVRVGKRDPDHFIPFFKVLLAKRNKFRRQGNIAAADKLACAINNIIANNIRNRLRKLANAPVKEMCGVH